MSQGAKYYPNPNGRGHHFRISVPAVADIDRNIAAKEEKFREVWSKVTRLI